MKEIFGRRWCIREDYSLAFALRAVADATLSSLVPAVNTAISSIPSLLKVTENMVHPGGFEPPTARFVAEYSIQLSYGCIGKIYFTADIDTATKAISIKRWCIREDYSPCGSPFGPLLAQRSLASLESNLPAPGGSHPHGLQMQKSLLAEQAFRIWSVIEDSNLRPLRPERSALPGCANHRMRGASYCADTPSSIP